MVVVFAILGLALAVPVLLTVAIALGPVALGIICAIGFGLVVFAVGNLLIAVGLFGRSVERAGSRRAGHIRMRHLQT